MEESPGYRRNLARAFVRLYRPLTCGRRRRSRLDQLMARWWTRLDVIAYRHLGISLGVKALGVDDVLLLRTRGRRSGQVREVLVAYVELDKLPVICAANGGSDRAPAWFENLQSGGPVEIERNGRRQTVAPVVLEGDERERAFAAVSRAFPHVRLYLATTNRPFPVVRLEALDAHAAGPVAPRELAVAVRGHVPLPASHRRIA
jgi:deazaflavin-dependent oxidoreductase (nitroreductase family)